MRYQDIVRNLELNNELLKEASFSDNRLDAFLISDIIFTTFAGKYQNNTNFLPFDKIQADFFKNLYIYDTLYFYYNKNENKCYILTKITKNEYKDILGLDVKKILDSEVISVQWNNHKFRYQSWYRLAEDIATLEKIYKINSITDLKKYKLITNQASDELIQKEVEKLLDISPFFIQKEVMESGVLGDEIQDINSSSNKTQLAMSNIIDWFNWKANLLGWTTAQEQKLERKTFAEGQIDLANTIYLDRITINNLKLFAQECKEKWDIDLDFSTTLELEPQDLISEQPNQEKESEVDLQ